MTHFKMEVSHEQIVARVQFFCQVQEQFMEICIISFSQQNLEHLYNVDQNSILS